MTFQLTKSQQQAVDSCGEKHVRAVDARNNSVYFLIPESDYQRLQQLLSEESLQAEIYEISKRNAEVKMYEVP